MVFLPLVIVILYSSLAVCKKSDAELVPKLDELVVTVEHTLKENSDGPDFQPRGTISLRSLKHQTGVFYQRDQLTKEELQLIQDMAESEDDVYYRIRVPSHFGVIENEPETFVSTYVKACALYESRLTETITISVDHLGYVYGVGLSLPVSQCEGKGNGAGWLPTHFNTTVNVVNQAAGAIPDTQTYVQRLEKEKAENAAGKGKDNRSFLAKYWMYIVPVVIFMLMTSQQPDQQGGGEGGS
jgi:hypothetical protein